MVATVRKVRGLFVALFALCVALTALPSVAFAAYATQTGYITISGVSPEDKVDIYRVVDYTYNNDNTVTWKFTHEFGINRNDYAAAANNSDAMKGYADQMATYVLNKDNNVQPMGTETVAAGATSVTFNGMDDGEYLVIVTPAAGTTKIYQNAIVKLEPTQDGQGGDWSLVNGGVNMVAKSVNQPPVDKKINGEDGPVSDYAEGQSVPFTITSTVPTYPSNAINKRFAISDTMSSGLDLEDGITVTIPKKGNEPQDITLTAEIDYTLTPTQYVGGQTFEIVFNYNQIDQYAGREIVVSYSATLTNDAASIENNTATVEFSRDPNTANSYETKDDEEKLYTYTINVLKQDADTKVPLQNATFELHKETPNGVVVGTLTTTGEHGTASVDGLAAGTYYLVETAAPEGYQLDATPIEVVITASTNDNATADSLIVSKTIDNTKTPALPVTGGAGTVAITAAGVVLVAGAAMLIVRARKSDN